MKQRFDNLYQLGVRIAQVGRGKLHLTLAGARLGRLGEVGLHPLDLGAHFA
jgi:hypothetical protein